MYLTTPNPVRAMSAFDAGPPARARYRTIQACPDTGLWRPVRPRWYDLPAWAKVLFKDGVVQFESNKVIFTHAGDDPDDCACCDGDCAYSETDCTHCDANKTTATWATVFSSVSFIGSCYDCDTSGSIENVSCSLNGAHDLLQVSSCVWEKTITNDATYDTDTSASCASPSSQTGDLIIRLTRGASDWTLEAGIGTGGTISYRLYTDTIPHEAAGNCDVIAASTNDITAYNCARAFDSGVITAAVSTSVDLGKDGSATIECVTA